MNIENCLEQCFGGPVTSTNVANIGYSDRLYTANGKTCLAMKRRQYSGVFEQTMRSPVEVDSVEQARADYLLTLFANNAMNIVDTRMFWKMVQNRGGLNAMWQDKRAKMCTGEFWIVYIDAGDWPSIVEFSTSPAPGPYDLEMFRRFQFPKPSAAATVSL